MKPKPWPTLALGVLLAAGVACRTLDPLATATPPSEAAAVTQPPAPATSPSTDTPTTPSSDPQTTRVQPPPSPTAPPTVTLPPTRAVPFAWRELSDDASGVRLSIPVDWVRVEATAVPLDSGQFLIADSAATAVALRNQAQLNDGAFILVDAITPTEVANSLDDATPTTVLTGLVTAAGLASRTPTRPLEQNGLAGAAVEVVGDPTGLLGAATVHQPLRLLLLQEPTTRRMTLFVLGSGLTAPGAYEAIFARIFTSVAIEAPTTPIAGRLGDGTLQSRTLAPGATDMWLFDAVMGQYVTVAVRSNDDLDLVLTLVSPSGITLATADRGYTGNSEALFDALLPESGTYRVLVSEFFQVSGRYTASLSLAATPQFGGGGRLEPGQAVTGELTRGQDDVWVFDGTAEEVYSIVLMPDSIQLDVFFELRGPDGRRVAARDESYSGDPEILSGFTITTTGEYQIVVSSFSNAGGPYTLALDRGAETTANFHDAGDLYYGAAGSESLQMNEVHTWFFGGRLGHDIEVLVTPLDAALDIDVWLLSPALERLVMQDEGLFGVPERIALTLPEDGEYILVVRDFYGTPGAYEITLDSGNYIVDAGALTPGEVVEAALPARFAHGWRYDTTGGEAITVTLQPRDNIDLIIWVYDPEGRRLHVEDSARLGWNERLNDYFLRAPGPWVLVIRERQDRPGGYILTLETGPP